MVRWGRTKKRPLTGKQKFMQGIFKKLAGKFDSHCGYKMIGRESCWKRGGFYLFPNGNGKHESWKENMEQHELTFDKIEIADFKLAN